MLTIVRKGTLVGDDLRQALEASHLHLAMGTSALEGARWGVPTVLLDFAYGPVPDGYEFRWLADAIDFDLGHQIMRATSGPGSVTSLAAIVAALGRDPMARSAEAFEYCQTRHSVDAGVDAFLLVANASQYRFSDIPAVLKQKSWLRRVYEGWRR